MRLEKEEGGDSEKGEDEQTEKEKRGLRCLVKIKGGSRGKGMQHCGTTRGWPGKQPGEKGYNFLEEELRGCTVPFARLLGEKKRMTQEGDGENTIPFATRSFLTTRERGEKG